MELLKTLSNMSPLGVIALLGYVVYLLVKNSKAVESVSNNHLSGLPDMEDSLKRIETLLMTMNANIIYIAARVNGTKPPQS